MRLHRFYVTQPLGEVVVIEDTSTIKQWLKVFRYSSGDFVILFNGDGYDYTYRIEKVLQNSCTLFYSEKIDFRIDTITTKAIFVPIIKKDLFELVVEKVTEFGITDIIPIVTERTENKNLNFERLKTIAKEATEQSKNRKPPIIHPVINFNDASKLLKELKVENKNTYVLTFFGESLKRVILNKTSNNEEARINTAFFVGPEGGWTENEESIFIKNEYKLVSLGNTVLRAETAAISCALLSSLF